MKQKLLALTIDATRDMAEQNDITPAGELGPDTALFDRDGLLDSMALVSLVIDLEQIIQSEFDATVELADEKALSQENSPYRTIQTLVDYAATQLDS